MGKAASADIRRGRERPRWLFSVGQQSPAEPEMRTKAEFPGWLDLMRSRARSDAFFSVCR
jgi:hypothetical protein